MIGPEIIDRVRREIRGLATNFEIDDYKNALADAGRETGWTTDSVADDFRIHWLKSRVKRHLLSYLYTESAHKFKFKQINLQHRFEQYRKIVRDMDREFREAKKEHPEKFTGADTWDLFGHKIDPGFTYDEVGRDRTYDSENVVQYGPAKSE